MDEIDVQARLKALETVVEYLLALEMVASGTDEALESGFARASVSVTGGPAARRAAIERAAENALADLATRARALAERVMPSRGGRGGITSATPRPAGLGQRRHWR